MSLPFLKKRPVAGLIMEYRKPDGFSDKAPTEEDQSDQGLTSCAEAAIRAVHAKDAAALAKAWQDAFEIMESRPHDEAGSEDMGNE